MRGYYYIILSQFEREAFNSGVYELIFCVSRKSYLYLYHSVDFYFSCVREKMIGVQNDNSQEAKDMLRGRHFEWWPGWIDTVKSGCPIFSIAGVEGGPKR